MLSRDLARALDPIQFARDCGIEPDPWQSDLLTTVAPKSLLLCARQTGKSTATSIVALHQMIFDPPTLVLLCSPGLSQSQELYRRLRQMLANLDGAPDVYVESALRLELRNGSRVLCLPGSEASARGFTPNLIICDEAARVPNDLYAALTPGLATTSGRFIALSTPFGRRGWFFDAWQGEGWQKLSITAEECPRISREFLDEQRAELGDLMYAQEFENRFVDDGAQVISSELIDAALRDDVEPLWPVAA